MKGHLGFFTSKVLFMENLRKIIDYPSDHISQKGVIMGLFKDSPDLISPNVGSSAVAVQQPRDPFTIDVIRDDIIRNHGTKFTLLHAVQRL